MVTRGNNSNEFFQRITAIIHAPFTYLPTLNLPVILYLSIQPLAHEWMTFHMICRFTAVFLPCTCAPEAISSNSNTITRMGFYSPLLYVCKCVCVCLHACNGHLSCTHAHIHIHTHWDILRAAGYGSACVWLCALANVSVTQSRVRKHLKPCNQWFRLLMSHFQSKTEAYDVWTDRSIISPWKRS